jgi:histidinol-phosphate aminotransferase
MDFERRHILKAGLAGTGVVALRASAAIASEAQEPALFGPDPGQARLNRNENPFGPAPSARQAIIDTAVKGCYYAEAANARLIDMIAERHGVKAANVVVGNGSTEVLCAAALIWGGKGVIVAPGLFWDYTVNYGEHHGARVIRVPLAADMGVDLAAMRTAALSPGVAMVHVCNPNNPTAMLADPNALRALAAAVTPHATLLVDEAYNELTDNPDANTLVDLVKSGHDIIVCRTFSKIYGMAGMRVGYAITTEANAALLRASVMGFIGNVSGIAGAIASYNDTAFLTRSKASILEARGMIFDAVQKAGLKCLPSQANFVFVEVPDADAVQKAMAARGIEIRPTYGTWSRWSRVSTGRIEDVRRYALALPEVIGALRS